MKNTLISILLVLLLTGTALAEDVVFGDFEGETELALWKSGFYDTASKETPPTLTLSKENATSGDNSLMIKFNGGFLPMVSLKTLPNVNDWYFYKSLSFDLTAETDTMLGVQVLQEKKATFDSRVLVKKGLSKLNFTFVPERSGSIDLTGGPVTELRFYFYKPKTGAVFYLDNIRLKEKIRKKDISNSEDQNKSWYKTLTFSVLGAKTSAPVALPNIKSALSDDFYEKQLGAKTTEEMEKLIRGNYLELKKINPKAVLSIFRNGEKEASSKVYSGSKTAFLSTHGPDTSMSLLPMLGEERELFMRHRVLLFSFENLNLPENSEILNAYFVLNTNKMTPGGSLFIAEAINRAWNENEVTAYTYDKDKFWNNFGGISNSGDDPDCLPLILAYGFRKEKVSAWDFTEAVKYWTNGKNANHGFFFPCLDGADYCSVSTNRAKNIKDRPAIYVIYVPK